jgi:prepilin-type N-terminal cleavage/methylation domain-containing protein
MVSKSFSNLKSGMGFIELIVVIAIILILSLISFPYYQQAKRNLALERSVTRLSQSIRRAQEMATSTQGFSGIPSTFPAGGYGVYAESVPADVTSYVIFADADGDKKYDDPGELVERISLESNVKIDSVNNNHAHVIFVPPDPTVVFTNLGGADGGLAQITIRVSMIDDPSKFHDIIINRAGLVDTN